MTRKAWLIARIGATLLSVATLGASTHGAPPAAPAPAPAAAGIGDALFEKLKGVLLGRIDPDTIEMARFAIKRPAEAATIYSRGAAQDYPFFAMIGAAKAAKGRDIPKVGVFTYAKCMTPITAIDGVFAQADATIDNAKGKADTSAAMGTAASIGAEYAKAGTAEAKAKVVASLAERVPYFGDIPTICAFAFETDLMTERNIQLVVTQTSQDVRTAYFAFKSGDVVTGVATLVALGVSNDAACALVDGAVFGGQIARTPILGELAREACVGFVGNVLDGVSGLVKGGVGLAEAGVNAAAGGVKSAACAVYSLIGNGCSSAEPAPTGYSTAAAWCTPHGGVQSFLSRSNQPDEYSVICNDNSQCSAKPGYPTRCATGAEIAAREAQQIAQIETEFQIGLPQWQAEFETRWLPRCPDESCKAGIRLVRTNAIERAKKDHEARPDHYFKMATHFTFEAADRQAVSVIDEVSYRLLPPRWSKSFTAAWNEACEDNVCRAGTRIVAANTLLLVQQRAAATPRPPYGETAALYAAADAQAKALLAESAQRAVQFNQKNTADAGIAWQLLTNGVWGRQCADTLCVNQVQSLSAKMKLDANVTQYVNPDQSSLWVQQKIGTEYGPKFKALIDESNARAAAKTPVVPAPKVRAVGPIEAFLQPRRTGRPDPKRRVAPPSPGPRRIVVNPAPGPGRTVEPAPRPAPPPRRIILAPAPAPKPTPAPNPSRGGRPPPRP